MSGGKIRHRFDHLQTLLLLLMSVVAKAVTALCECQIDCLIPLLLFE